MRQSIILLALLFAGCQTTVPIKSEFPKAAPELMKKCEALKQVDGNKVAITDLLKVVVHNYTLYYECSTKVDGWQEWYNEQKRLYEDAK